VSYIANFLFVTATLALPGVVSAPIQQDPGASPTKLAAPPSATEVLRDLCAQHHNEQEPVCEERANLTEDESWLVVREACRMPQNTQNCRAFRELQGGVLIHDFKSDSWMAQWESESYPLKFDVAGVPTLRLKPRRASAVKIMVTNISPLTYSALAGTPTEADLAIISDLKTFLGFAGTGIQALLKTPASLTLDAARQSIEDVLTSSPVALSREVGPAAKRATPPTECVIEPPDVGPLSEAVAKRFELLAALQGEMGQLETVLDKLATAREQFIRAAQTAEDGRKVTRSELDVSVPDVLAAYDSFEKADGARSRFAAHTAVLQSCQPILGAYALLIGAPPDASVLSALAAQVAGTEGCSELSETLKANAKFLANLGNKACAPKLKAAMEVHLGAMKPLVDRLLKAKDVEDKVWQALDKVRAARKDVLVGTQTLSRQRTKGLRYMWGNELIRALVITRPNPELKWSKVQSHSILMKADTPYVKELTLARGTEEKREYKIASATGQILGYGVGVIYTPLYESTWKAVAVPGTDTKVIAEADRETRAGDLAGFLSYRFLEHGLRKDRVRPSVDFGVGLTSDRPAFFLGMSAEILRAARIGFGWTPQRVSKLAEGQRVNETIVTNSDDIRTVKRFDASRYYLSFTFALDGLSLFTKQ